MNVLDSPASQFKLYVLGNMTSQALMDEETIVCPLCSAPAMPIFLRASLADFVAALLCIPCRALFRAVDTFSLRD